MKKSRVLMAIAFISLALGATVFHGCGSNTAAPATKFTIVGSGT